MEPRFLKRGNFNEREAYHRAFPLQWNHAFSNVEISTTLSTLLAVTNASMEPRFLKRGNLTKKPDANGQQIASMEPRFLKRGNANKPEVARASISCFNGTTLSQTWKFETRARERGNSFRFNGTTLSQTWKCG